MKTSFLLSSLFALTLSAGAQQVADPVLMTINGKPVTKAEFEYSFHKNGNIEGAVEKKTVEEYVPMFINYKLKVAAAEKAGLDTLTSFKKEFHTYRDMQLTPYLVDQHFIDSIAQMVYDNTVKKLDGKDLIETALAFAAAFWASVAFWSRRMRMWAVSIKSLPSSFFTVLS